MRGVHLLLLGGVLLLRCACVLYKSFFFQDFPLKRAKLPLHVRKHAPDIFFGTFGFFHPYYLHHKFFSPGLFFFEGVVHIAVFLGILSRFFETPARFFRPRVLLIMRVLLACVFRSTSVFVCVFCYYLFGSSFISSVVRTPLHYSLKQCNSGSSCLLSLFCVPHRAINVSVQTVSRWVSPRHYVLFSFLFFSLISLIIADGPHHYHPACGH